MNKKFVKIISAIMALAVLAGCFATLVGCNDETQTAGGFDNESDALVFSTQEVDKVFNPFFSTSATDSNVVGMTQIGMLGNDKDGNIAYGDDEAVVVKDLAVVTTGTEDVDQITTYYFVLKNNVKFSNGSPLTMKDVLFNLYVYLDPAYTGSSTIYSTDIVGLKEYRTQESRENEQDNFKLQFQIIATTRIDALIYACNEIIEDHSSEGLTSDSFEAYLVEYAEENGEENMKADYDKAVELFHEELESDYSNSMDQYEDTVFTDEDGTVYKNLFTTDVEVFLYNEGFISWNKKDAKLESSLTNDPAELKTWTKDHAIEQVFLANIPLNVCEVLMYWQTSVNLNDYIMNQAMEEYFKTATRAYPNISGIKFANRTETVAVNGVEYGVPTYGADGGVTEGNEVLSISIHDVDPKAIWNFAFTVAPMYYYSDAAHIEKFDYESNFGVEYGSAAFMTDVVKNPDKIGVPVGAGAYAASKSDGGITNIQAGDFYSMGVIYFERNPHFLMGAPKIKKIRFKVVAAAQMLNSLYNNEIDYAEPNAKPKTIAELDSKKSDGIGNKSIRTSGYGYIGINAGKVPDLEVRQAIMHAINTQTCVDYYQTTATAIHRSMSMSNWAYPDGCTPYYPYIGGPVPANLSVVNPTYAEYVTELGLSAGEYLTKDQQKAFIIDLVETAGYELNGNNIYQKGSHQLIYTFTIAGQETDHPAWTALYQAGEFLNTIGFQINTTTDAQALRKLASGALTVWAAAWGSTIDPDMYQVYHKESSATSVLNWGYKQILMNVGNKYDRELALVEELSEYIDKGRKTNDQEERARIYSIALDIVMQLAIELPTYQRDDLFAFNTDKIDVSTLTPDSQCSPYKGLTSDLHNVSLNTEK